MRMRPGCAAILSPCDEVIVAQSCDKNFSVYRDRVGSPVRQDRLGRSDRARRWATCSKCARECGRCRPITAQRRCTSSSRIPSFGRAGWSSSTRCATGSTRCAADRRRRPAARPIIGRQFGMFSMLPLSKEQVLKLRERSRDLHGRQRALQRRRHGRRPDRPIYRRRGRGAGRLRAMADRDPGRVSAEVDWREVARLVLTSREMDRIEEEELVPGQKGPLPVFRARP